MWNILPTYIYLTAVFRLRIHLKTYENILKLKALLKIKPETQECWCDMKQRHQAVLSNQPHNLAIAINYHPCDIMVDLIHWNKLPDLALSSKFAFFSAFFFVVVVFFELAVH